MPRRWSGSTRWLLVLLLCGGVALPAAAQTLSPILSREAAQARIGRLSLAAYAAQWQNPFRITISTVSPQLNFQKVSRTVRLVGDTPTSPLLDATYALDRRWSVDFWYNPIRGERLRQNVQLVDRLLSLDFERNVDLANLQFIYNAPRGLKLQVGYYDERGTVTDRTGALPTTHYTLVSWNLWVAQQFDARVRGSRITPFVEAGYHPAASLHRAASLLLGISGRINDRVSLSGSVWLFDLSNPATRVTGGVVVGL